MKKNVQFNGGFRITLILTIMLVGFAQLFAQNQISSSNLIGSTTNWGNNDPAALTVVFDGDFETFMDGWENWGFVGYDFNNDGATVATWKYAPRSGWEDRMNGTELRGSNSSNFLNEFDVLYTVPEAPEDSMLTEASINSTVSYRYIYWFGGGFTFTNTSEFQLFDAGGTQLMGTGIGPELGSQWCDTCTYENAFDGDFETYVEGPQTIGFVGYDFGEGNGGSVSSWKYAPRTDFPDRLNNTELRGSNDLNYLNNYTVLYTITETPPTGELTEAIVTDNTPYRYVYWKGNAYSYGNISEMEIYGSVITSTNDIEMAQHDFSLFPNPAASGNFSIQLKVEHVGAHVNVKIYNTTGQVVFEKNVANSGTIKVNENLKTGMYLVQIDNSACKRIIVE